MPTLHDRPAPWMLYITGSLLFGTFLAGCAAYPSVGTTEMQAATPTISTSTSTPTTSPTPTATALTITVEDDRPTIPQEANPLGLITRCGVADLFDFPLDPPDAATVTGGQDFGVYRDRYEGFHTGEDWWYERRRSLGKPIYSIGNGRVRYAAPYGWGEDLGTLVIEHILPNGRRLFSFYGHVDPDSLTLRVGQCVLRGEQVGVIGDPKSSPHLHFEIRMIFADAPGPGYWSVDPSKSGWYPPSQTIEFSRYAADQRLRWWAAIEAASSKVLGWIDEALVLIQEDTDIVAYNTLTGEELLRFSQDGMGIQAGWNPQSKQLYLIDSLGELKAYAWNDVLDGFEDSMFLEEWIWKRNAEGRGIPQLIPLGSGVLVARSDYWWGFDRNGGPRWSRESNGRLVDWIEGESGILALTTGDNHNLWTITPDAVLPWELDASGKLISRDEGSFLYAPDGLFMLDEHNRSYQSIYQWDRAQIDHAALLGIGNGDLLVLRRDIYDYRIMNISPQGSLLWERSLKRIVADEAYLSACGGSTWLLTEEDRQSSVRFRLFELDGQGIASEIFSTIVRDSFPADSWLSCADDGPIGLWLGGKRRILLDLLVPASP